jgi:hypothetical protein
MSLELKELKTLHDKAFNHGQITREKASDDLVFYHVTQWDDNLLGESQLQYKGQFDVIRKAGRHILSELRANPVQVDFQPVDDTREDGAEILDGLYRGDDRRNTSLEAYMVGSQESVVCGVGAWFLYAEYVSNRSGDSKQVIKRKPIYEANNKCFWDPNAKLLDKADADYVSVLHAYSQDGYEKLYKNLTNKEYTGDYTSFKNPEESYTFPWISEDKKVYVVDFYHSELVKDTIYTLEDAFDNTLKVSEIEMGDGDTMDTLIDEGYSIVDEKEIERYRVTKYIASGDEILKSEMIAGEYIPVVPVYGERAFVEDEEYYEGITRLAKDPQRLRNFQLSYLADIVSRSPRAKPIFSPEQIQGFEDMYSESGAENNYPYLLQNIKTPDGTPLPIGPVSMMPESQIPTALVASIDLTRSAIEDVADPGLPQNMSDPDMSGKAIYALQSRIDQQAMVYQQNLKHAKRRDAEIYASMASEVYSSPRTVMLTKPDGTRAESKIMEQVLDPKTGNVITINDLTNSEFDVYADVGPSYQSQKEQTMDKLSMMSQSLPEGDPMRSVIMLELISMSDGDGFENVRTFAKKQLVQGGFKEAETDEEKEWLKEVADQPKEPDAMAIAAQAEQMKAQAMLNDSQTKSKSAQNDAEVSQAETQIKAFDSQTKRLDVQVKAQESGANIDFKRNDQFQRRVDSADKGMLERQKIGANLRARAS